MGVYRALVIDEGDHGVDRGTEGGAVEGAFTVISSPRAHSGVSVVHVPNAPRLLSVGLDNVRKPAIPSFTVNT